MKKLTIFVLIIAAVSVGFSSCVSLRTTGIGTAGNSGKVPPGQAKKMFGTKSAKPFAPGQRKKR